eukprot:Skav218514  [mRNA]  locus=scaffold1564:342744:345770:+ [translate_table: standard]
MVHSPPLNVGILPQGKFCLHLGAGAQCPLATAVQRAGVAVLPIDIVLSAQNPLLHGPTYERILRVAASGQVSYTAAAPSCFEFSLPTLPQPGPSPVRTLDHPFGIPNPTLEEQQRLDSSREVLHRCLECLHATVAAGGHGHIEQPTNALSWQDPQAHQWFMLHGRYLVAVPACAHELDVDHSWLFSASLESLTSLAAECIHTHEHPNLANVRGPPGQFLSGLSVVYPISLCDQLAHCITPLCSPGAQLSLDQAVMSVPTKALQDQPHALTDGGGISSQPDWSTPQISTNPFRSLRAQWTKLILESNLHHAVAQRFLEPSPELPLSEDQLLPFRGTLHEFCVAANQPAFDWTVPPGQPFCLHALQQIATFLDDPDCALFPSLLAGVPTGFHDDIPPSHVFTPIDRTSSGSAKDLSEHVVNWRSAEDHEEIVSALLQEELDQGWVKAFPGDISQAHQVWPGSVAVGKLSLAFSDTRPARLVMDPSVSGANAACFVPEKQSMPTPFDVIRCFPLRELPEPQSSFSIDIKSAHKRVRVRSSEQGLLMFRHKGQLYHYTVCPFGAKFSQHWWGRMGSFLVRWFHAFLYTKHSLLLFVDDFLISMPQSMAALQATYLVLLCQLFHIPVSWKKCWLGPRQTWIGWSFDLNAGLVALHKDKCAKLLQMIQYMIQHPTMKKKALEKFIGLAMWCTSLYPSLRVHLHWLYDDLARPPDTQFSCDPGAWPDLQRCLSQELVFVRSPPHTSIPVGSKLISVRHHPVHTIPDLMHVPITPKRIWMRIRDPASPTRKLSPNSLRVLALFDQWLLSGQWVVSMRPKPRWDGEAYADAFADKHVCGIGGFIQQAGQPPLWFSERFSGDDFTQQDILLGVDLQKHIGFLEALAQVANLHLLIRESSHSRVNLTFVSGTDNTGAESRLNTLFSTKYPMCCLLERVSFLLASHNMILDAQHTQGFRNTHADILSRWVPPNPLPAQFIAERRVGFTIQHLSCINPRPSLHPARPSVHPASATLYWRKF